MAKKRFKTTSAKSKAAPDAETLFQDLRQRDASLQHLYAHQADLIRAYHDKHEVTADVALELTQPIAYPSRQYD